MRLPPSPSLDTGSRLCDFRLAARRPTNHTRDMNNEPPDFDGGIRDEIRLASRRICRCIAICTYVIAAILATERLWPETVRLTLAAAVVGLPLVGIAGYAFVRSMRKAMELDRKAKGK